MELLNLGNMMNPISTPYDKAPQIAPITPTAASSNLGGIMNPAGAASAPTAPQIPTGPAQKSIIGWDNFLGKLATDNNMQQSLMQAGLQMMTPKAAGENTATKILQGTQVGFQGYEQRKEADTVDKLRTAATAQSEASTAGTLSDNRVKDATEKERIAQVGQETKKNELALTGADLDNKIKAVEEEYADRVKQQDLAKSAQDITASQQQVLQSKTYMNYLDEQIADSKMRGKIYEDSGGVTPAQPSGEDQMAMRMAEAMYPAATHPQENKQAYLYLANKRLEKKQMSRSDMVMKGLEAGGYFAMDRSNATQSKRADMIKTNVYEFVDAWYADPNNATPSAVVPTATPGTAVTAPAGNPFPGLPPEASGKIEADIQVIMQTGKTREQAIEELRPNVQIYMEKHGLGMPAP